MIAPLNVLSLREQVYNYLRQQMNVGDLVPGSTINIDKIARKLEISKTPLRDALIHLEIEGFVTILPRKGVLVNSLDLLDIKNAYEAIGMVEASIVLDCYDKITPSHIAKLEDLNGNMISDIKKNSFKKLFEANLAFHDVYLNLSENDLLRRIILPIKQRLYDFPRHSYLRNWELRNCDEHQKFIDYLKDGEVQKASDLLREVHWSYQVQESFIKEFYDKKQGLQ